MKSLHNFLIKQHVCLKADADIINEITNLISSNRLNSKKTRYNDDPAVEIGAGSGNFIRIFSKKLVLRDTINKLYEAYTKNANNVIKDFIDRMIESNKYVMVCLSFNEDKYSKVDIKHIMIPYVDDANKHIFIMGSKGHIMCRFYNTEKAMKFIQDLPSNLL